MHSKIYTVLQYESVAMLTMHAVQTANDVRAGEERFFETRNAINHSGKLPHYLKSLN